MATTPLLAASLTRLDNALARARAADVDLNLAAVHVLAQQAALAGAATLKLEWSDQGPWLVVMGAEDADGEDVDFDDEDSVAVNFEEDTMSVWGPFMAPAEDSTVVHAGPYDLPVAKVLDHFAPTIIRRATDWQTAPVSLDGGPVVMAQYDANERWNGWLCPHLDPVACLQVLTWLVEQNDPDGPRMTWDFTAEGALIVTQYDVTMPGSEDVDVVGPDKDGLYALGGYAWTWSREDV